MILKSPSYYFSLEKTNLGPLIYWIPFSLIFLLQVTFALDFRNWYVFQCKYLVRDCFILKIQTNLNEHLESPTRLSLTNLPLTVTKPLPKLKDLFNEIIQSGRVEDCWFKSDWVHRSILAMMFPRNVGSKMCNRVINISDCSGILGIRTHSVSFIK